MEEVEDADWIFFWEICYLNIFVACSLFILLWFDIVGGSSCGIASNGGY